MDKMHVPDEIAAAAEMIGKPMAAIELRSQARSLRAMIEGANDEHRPGLMAAAGNLELRALELES